MISRRRTVVVIAAIALIATILGGCGSGSTSTSAKPSRGFTTRAVGHDPSLVSYYADPLPSGQTFELPRMQCPADYPYVLDQNYATGAAWSFRLENGVEFTNFSWGFDAYFDGAGFIMKVDKSDPNHPRYIATGIQGTATNSVTYWSPIPPKSYWTLTLHCTSDLGKAVIRAR